MFVFLSKFLPQLFYPVSFVCVLLLFALLFARKAGTKNRLIGFAILLLLICGNKFPGNYLIHELESAYEPYSGGEKAGAIVVLGGATESKAWPRQSVELNGAADRIFYGSDLLLNGSGDLLLLGGSYLDWLDGQTVVDGEVSSPASEMAEIALRLGVPREKILIQNRSVNTYEEAVEDAKLLKERGISKIILVSSATHMRRAVPLFEKQGLEVIPAPVDYSFSDEQWKDFTHISWENAYTWILPSAGNIRTLENAFKEYLGYFVYHLRGWL